jgi:hypothetical protein
MNEKKKLEDQFFHHWSKAHEELANLGYRERLTKLLTNLFDSIGVKQRRRGKVPIVLKHLIEMYPPSEHPRGFPDPPDANEDRKDLLAVLRVKDPRLASLDWKTMNKAIKEYDRLVTNSQ